MAKELQIVDIEPGTPVELPEAWQKSLDAKFAVVKAPDALVSNATIYPHLEVYRHNTLEQRDVSAVRRNEVWITLTGKPAATVRAAYAKKIKEGNVGLYGYSPAMGCDPEIFVRHGDGSLFPAYEFLTDKQHAKQREESIYWDGFQAEFAPVAQSCLALLHDAIQIGMKNVLAAARAKDPKAYLTIENTLEVPDALLLAADDKYVQFGCSPSKNAYNDSPAIPGDARVFPYRFAGGHMHAGLGRIGKGSASLIVKACDAIVGVASVGMFAGLESPIRRMTYGRAGEYRLPVHGLEYRVLSNAHLCHPAISHLTFELFRLSVRVAMGGLYPYVWDATEDEIREAINACDVDLARKIIRRNEKSLSWMLNKRGWTLEGVAAGNYLQNESRGWHKNLQPWIFKVIDEGVVSIIDPKAIESNWSLGGGWVGQSLGKDCTWNSLVSHLPEPVPAVMA